ncbi:MAG: 30S ribosomal protein S4 [Verrucomicrobia bacterium]|nr:30S ribosomal protein S4 [Verrucomicrobiota bacterium]
MKYTGPKVKRSRRVGIPLTRKASKWMDRKPGAAGMHRSRFSKKVSDYGRQLLEKQRLCFQYNITDRKLHNYYVKASGKHGNTGTNLMHLLESRLDALTLRAGFAPTIYAARQLVGHGHVQVDGKRINIPSFLVRPGSQIAIKEKSRALDVVKNAAQDSQPVPYLTVDKEGLTALYTRLPEMNEVPVICEVPVVVEFYAK